MLVHPIPTAVVKDSGGQSPGPLFPLAPPTPASPPPRARAAARGGVRRRVARLGLPGGRVDGDLQRLPRRQRRGVETGGQIASLAPTLLDEGEGLLLAVRRGGGQGLLC